MLLQAFHAAPQFLASAVPNLDPIGNPLIPLDLP
jgi:hypothetical protein